MENKVYKAEVLNVVDGPDGFATEVEAKFNNGLDGKDFIEWKGWLPVQVPRKIKGNVGITLRVLCEGDIDSDTKTLLPTHRDVLETKLASDLDYFIFATEESRPPKDSPDARIFSLASELCNLIERKHADEKH